MKQLSDEGNNTVKNYQHNKCFSLYEEMHLRPYPRAQIPCLVGHLCVLKSAGKRLLYDLLYKIASKNNLDLPNISDVFYQRHCENYKIRYEQHSEFETLTILLPFDEVIPIFSKNPFEVLPPDDFAEIENDCDCLVKLIIELRNEPNDLAGKINHQFIFEKFFPNYLTEKQVFKTLVNGSKIMQDRADVFTSFRQDNFGYAKYLLFNHNLSETSAGRLLTRLVEFENYRILALLGLQPAKAISAAIFDIDADLARVMTQISIATEHKDRENLMQDLIAIAQTVESYRGQTSQRFAATAAYYNQVKSIFEVLKESRLPGFQILEIFCDRRLKPAVTTCTSVNNQLEHLSRRIDRISDLLRTEIDLNIENQNIILLAAINKRADMQIKMQHTVESVSVVAISYYMLGILGYFLSLFLDIKHKELILGALVIPIAIAIWLLQKVIINRVTQSHDNDENKKT